MKNKKIAFLLVALLLLTTIVVQPLPQNEEMAFADKTDIEEYPVTFEYQSSVSEEPLPQSLIDSCPDDITAPLDSLIIPPQPEQAEQEIDGQRWKFDKWVPGSNEVVAEGISFIGYWVPVRNIQISKVWSDGDNQDGKRPESVTINLLANGEATDKSLTLEEANDWTDSFTNLAEYKDGAKIEYTIEEVLVDEYETSVAGDAQTGYVVTNSRTPETVSVAGNKTWDDNNDQEGERPTSITINLLQDGTKIDSKVVTEADSWSWNFVNLPKYNAGSLITYTVTEDPVANYSSTISGYDVTNSYEPKELTEPEELTEPTEATEPTEPTGPMEPMGPTEPTGPMGPMGAFEPTDPIERIDPMEPTVLAGSTGSTGSIEQVELSESTASVEPKQPAGPEPSEALQTPSTGECRESNVWLGIMLISVVALLLVARWKTN